MFNDVVLKYKGGEYRIDSTRVMQLIEVIEDNVTLAELGRKNGVPLVKVAKAYSAALNFAGARTNPEEIYGSLFGGKCENIPATVAALISICVPPQDVKEVATVKKTKGKSTGSGT